MTRMTIQLNVTEELRVWAANPAWKKGDVTLTDGTIILNGTAHKLRQAFNAIVQMGLIDTPQSDRAVFAAYDPNGDRHQITSKEFVYNFCVAYRQDGEIELAEQMKLHGSIECWEEEYADLVNYLNNKGGPYVEYAEEQLRGARSLQEYFEIEYADRVVPVQEKLKAGGFDKYIVPTSSWKFMREDAEKRADDYRQWGNHKDVIILQGKRE